MGTRRVPAYALHYTTGCFGIFDTIIVAKLEPKPIFKTILLETGLFQGRQNRTNLSQLNVIIFL